MKFEFLWEMQNGHIGNYSVNAVSEYDARKIVQEESPEVIDCLIEIQQND